jgi:hypothetical protein
MWYHRVRRSAIDGIGAIGGTAVLAGLGVGVRALRLRLVPCITEDAGNARAMRWAGFGLMIAAVVISLVAVAHACWRVARKGASGR